MRSELIKMFESGEIDHPIKYINKMYKEYEHKRMQKANEFLTNLLMSKFSNAMGGLDAIQDPKQLEEDLKKDVTNLVSLITPYLPYLCFLWENMFQIICIAKYLITLWVMKSLLLRKHNIY